MLTRYHAHHNIPPNQCTATLVQTVDAPLPLVWSMVRCFSKPQTYKLFITSCTIREGDGGTGSVREIKVQSDLPATRSTERLDFLDDDMRVMKFSIICGDHRLVNYQSRVSVHEEEGGKTVVMESYVVDIPPGNTKKERCWFTSSIIGWNLNTLAAVATKSCIASN
ncbi:abscisic acid receptor PYL12-like [Cornus florida]|uniref:abscisic acid receptor PYL12-like n=1 Tax=Cornus florida TaxID=4283 RepID=UPI00289BEFED|nr:abscisic acid receptor PYL12-like [Cornus florida]